MDSGSALALGIVMGIIMIWFGIVLILASLPLAKGEANARGYNYRPWQPKFVKSLSDEQVNEIGKRQARYAIWAGLLMMASGFVSIVFAAVGLGEYALYLFILPISALIVLIVVAYAQTYSVAKRGTQQK